MLGRVIETVEGHDGKIRSVKVKRGDGAISHHSINHLYPLELTQTRNHFFNNDEEDEDPSDKNQVPRTVFPDNAAPQPVSGTAQPDAPRRSQRIRERMARNTPQ